MQYELSADNSIMREGYGRLYTFGQNSSNGYVWYGLNLPTANGHITKWNTFWVDPKQKGHIVDATFYDGKIFYLDSYSYGVKTGVIPINENGMLGLSSMNTELPGGVKLSAGKSIVSFNDVLYVLNASGRVVSAPIDPSGTIYEWYDLGKIPGRPVGDIYGETFSYPSHWYSSAYLTTTKQGLLSISTKFIKTKKNGKQVLQQETTIHLAKLPITDKYVDPSAEALTYYKRLEEKIIKPESEIKTLDYVRSLNMFFAWDEVQNRLLRSEDKGKTWKYTKLSFPRDQRTNNSHSGMLKQIVISSDEKTALCLLTDGLYRVDLEFVKWDKLGDKQYYNESVANKQQFAVNKENPKMLLMPIGKTVYKSGNYGKNWIERNRGLEYYKFGAIAYVPWNNKSVLLEGGAYYSESMYYFSQDEGENWILFKDWLKNEGFTGAENVRFNSKSGSAKIISPNDKITFIIGVSEIGGTDRNVINVVKIDWEKKQISSIYYQTGIRQLAFNDALVVGENFQTILVSGTFWDSNTKSKLPETFRSVDGGKTFGKIVGDDNKSGLRVYSFCKDSESQNTVWGGGLGGVFVSRDAGETWKSTKESFEVAHNENEKKSTTYKHKIKKKIDLDSLVVGSWEVSYIDYVFYKDRKFKAIDNFNKKEYPGTWEITDGHLNIKTEPKNKIWIWEVLKIDDKILKVKTSGKKTMILRKK